MENTRIQKLLDFLQEDGNDPFLLYALATEYNNLGDVDLALKYYEDLVQSHPNYVGTYYHLGKLYLKLNKDEKGIAVLQNGMKVAREIRDNHAFNELQSAYNQAAGLDYEDD